MWDLAIAAEASLGSKSAGVATPAPIRGQDDGMEGGANQGVNNSRRAQYRSVKVYNLYGSETAACRQAVRKKKKGGRKAAFCLWK